MSRTRAEPRGAQSGGDLGPRQRRDALLLEARRKRIAWIDSEDDDQVLNLPLSAHEGA